MMFTPENVILVTGASSGIGLAIARQCNALGATVLACGRDVNRLEEAASGCAAPGHWRNVPRDLAQNMEELPAWVRGLSREHGRLYGLAHCAGTAIMDSLRSYDPAQAQDFFNLNFSCPMLLARGFADRRVHVKGGSMLFIASVAGKHPEKGHLIYGAIKAALIAAVKSISQEVAPLGLRANCLSPGIVDTPMQQAAEAVMGPDYRQKQLADYPLGFGAPEDVAALAAFLLSPQARWISGENYTLSGGRY